jgi:peptidoglycan/xylan/chitin deacetylase (PgdA/CDA1 family)
MADLVKHVAASLPVPFLFHRMRRQLRGGVVFPLYHAVSDVSLPHLSRLYSIRTTRGFERDLDFLLQHFEPVSMKQVLETSPAEAGLRPRMVLSFDDGLVQCHQTIMPLLQRKGVPAIFFLNNDFIDNRDLFYRYRVSLLLERMPRLSVAEQEKAAELMHCRRSDLRAAVRNICYLEREMTGRLAQLWGFSFDDYLRNNPVYMSTSQIRDMTGRGFEVGAHGTDHPQFSRMTPVDALAEIRRSVDDIVQRFRPEYRYFAFPFTDHGVADDTIRQLFDAGIIDAGFGTAGLKEDRWAHYFQRIPMEFGRYTGKKLIKGELLRRDARRLAGKNMVDRKYVPGGTERHGKGGSPLKVNTLLIGAGRSGTTSICDVLEQHPGVCYSVVKEVYYFSIPDLYKRGKAYLHSFFKDCTGKPVVATADTYLLIDYEAIRRIYDYNPEMKLIVLLRDPVDRAFSSYRYSVNYGHHKPYAHFTDSIAAEASIEKEPDVVKRNNLGHFYAGLYSRHLEEWLKVFGRDRLFILPTGELRDDPGSAVSRLLEFLELPPADIRLKRLNVHAVPRFKALEQTLLDREGLLRRAVRKLTPWLIKQWIIRSGLVEKVFRMNRKEVPVPELPDEEREKAAEFFREDMERLEERFHIRGIW